MVTTWVQRMMRYRCASIPKNPLDFGAPEREMTAAAQSIGADLIRDLNGLRKHAYPDDSSIDARTAAYELAFRMQRSIPQLLDFSQETAETRALYGLDLPHCQEFAGQLLAARRCVEQACVSFRYNMAVAEQARGTRTVV